MYLIAVFLCHEIITSNNSLLFSTIISHWILMAWFQFYLNNFATSSLPIVIMDSAVQCLGRFYPSCSFCKGKMTQPSPLLRPKPWASWFSVLSWSAGLGLIYGMGKARKRNLFWLFSLIFPSQQETKTQCVRIATKGKKFVPPSKITF